MLEHPFRKLVVPALLLLAASTLPLVADASPQGGSIVGGAGSITAPDANTTNIVQRTGSMAIDWQSFNLATQDSVNFQQPSASAAVLNRILDQNPSQIFGSINANGRVFLSNPNGIIFGETATVNVGALIAAGMAISADDFMRGDYRFNAAGDGIVINRGLINAASGGSVGLIGNAVINEGFIVADYGTIELSSGSRAVINFDGDGLLNIEVDQDVIDNATDLDSAVHNSGSLIADGGQVALTARTAQGLFDNAINNEGLVQARRIENTGGVIRLVGNGATVSSGVLDASGDNGTGGSVQVLGDTVTLTGTARVDASGDLGGGVVLVGGDYKGAGDVRTATHTVVESGAHLSADAHVDGDGGDVVVWADDTTDFAGSISARANGRGGDGGNAEVSGKQHLLISGHADLGASNGTAGTLLLDPGSVDIVDGPNTAPPASMDTINDGWVNVQLFLSSLAISTANSTNGGTQDLTLDAAADIIWGSANLLTLTGVNSVVIDGTITSNGSGSLTLNGGAIDINDTITLTTGTFTSSGTTFDNSGGVITSGGGDIGITQTGAVTLGAAVNTSGTGTITVASDASVIVDALVSTTGTGTLSLTADAEADGTGNVDINVGGNNLLLQSNGGVIALQGADFVLGTGETISTGAGTGTVSITPSVATAGISLGTGGGMLISESDLESITTGTLLLGSATYAGTITVGSDLITISPINFDRLILRSAEVDIGFLLNIGSKDMVITTGDAARLIDINNAAPVGTNMNLSALELNKITADTLTIGDAGHTGGIVLSQAVDMSLSNIASTLVLQSAEISIGFGFNLGARDFTILSNADRAISLGVDGDGEVNPDLDLTAAELGNITATTLTIGDAGSGNITIYDAISSGATNITLASGGTITETTGTITTAVLSTSSVGGTTLNQANVVEAFTAVNTTGNIALTNNTAGGTLDLRSVTTNGGNLTVTETDAIDISAALDAGAGTVDLNAGGLINQSAGAITAAVLDTSSVGGTTLNQANVVEAFTAVNTTGNIALTNNTAGGTLDLRSVTTNGGNLTVTETDAIDISAALDAGAGTVDLNAGAAINQSAGAITAAVLDTNTMGGATLNQANVVEAFTAVNTTGNIALTNNTAGGTLDLRSVTTNGGNLTVTETDAIDLSAALDAGAGTVDLNAGGLINQSAGAITAAVLDTSSVGGTTLNQANVVEAFTAVNTTGNIALTNNTAGGTLDLRSVTTNGGNLTVTETDAIDLSAALDAGAGTVDLNAGGLINQSAGAITAAVLDTNSVGGTTLNQANVVEAFTAVNTTNNIALTNNTAGGTLDLRSVTTNGGNLTVTETDAIDLSAALDAGAGTVDLNAGAAINQSAGAITAAVLDTNTMGGATLNQANVVEAFTAVNTTGNIALTNNTAGGTLDLRSVTTNGGNLTVTETDAIDLSGALDAGAGTVDLNAGGLINQSAGAITAAVLDTSSVGGTTLNQANVVEAFTAVNTTGNIALTNNTAGGTLDLRSVTTNGGNLTVTETDAIDLSAALDAGAGTVDLNAGGLINQSAGAITAGLLDTSSVGGTTLNQANVVEAFTAVNTTGNIALTNNTAGGTLDLRSVTTNGGNLTVTETDAIDLSAALDAGAGTVDLNAGGLINQSAGAITAAVLDTSSVGGTTLNQANVVEAFTAVNTTGNIALTNNTAGGTLDLRSVTTNGGNLTVTETDAIDLSAALDAGAGTVDLNAGGLINQSAGAITAAVLDTNTMGGATLNQANVVEAFTAVNTTGNIALTNNTAGGTLDLRSVTTNGGNLTVTETDAIDLSGALDAGAGTVDLNAGGLINQSAGAITAAVLDTNTMGGATLNQANVVEAFTAVNTTGNIALTNNTAGGTLDLRSVTTNGGNLTVTETDAIDLSGALDAGAGTVDLNAGGLINQSAGAITAGLLDTSSVGGTTLNASNAVSSFTATNTGNGNVELTTNTALTLGSITNNSGAGNQINLFADTMTFGASIDVGTGTVTLSTSDLNRAIQVGAAGTGSTLDISQAMLDQITATSNVTIGASNHSGALSLVGTIDDAARTGTFALVNQAGISLNADLTRNTNTSFTGGGITQAAATTVDAGAGLILVDAGGGAIDMAGRLTTTAAGNAVRIIDAGTAALGDITAVNGTVRLGEGGASLAGDIVQNAGTVISANTLTISGGGAVTLANGNRITNLGSVTRGGAFNLNDADGLIVSGALTGGATNNAVTLTTRPGELVVNGDITGNQVSLFADTMTFNVLNTIDAGNGTVTLSTGDPGRAIQVGVAGTIVDPYLGITPAMLGRIASASGVTIGRSNHTGSLSLDAAINDVTRTGAFALVNQAGIALNADLTLDTNVSFEGAGITQAAATTVNAGAGLILVDANDGAIDMTGTLSTTNSTAAAVRLVDASSAVLGNISAAAGTAVLGEAAANDITGAITQTTGTVIDAAGLAVNGGAAVTLDGNNTIGSLGSVTRGGAFTLNDTAGGLIVSGALTGGATGNAVTLTTAGGALAVNGNITGNAVTLTGAGVTQAAATTVDAGAGLILVDANDGAIDMAGTLSTTGAGNSVRLVDASSAVLGNISAAAGTAVLGEAAANDITGAITQTTGTVIDAAGLAVNGGAAVTLDGNNTIGSLGSVTRGGAFTLNDTAGGLIVSGALTGGATGNAVTLTTAGGALAVNGNITGNAVTLTGAGITQAAATTVDAGAGLILVDANGGAIDMTGTLSTTGAGNAVRLVDASSAVLGNITAAAGTVVLGEGGITGDITQNAGTLITAGTLTVNGGGAVTLGNGNAITNLGNVTRGGAFTLNDSGGLTVSGALTGGATNNAVTLTTAGGALIVNADIIGDGVTLTTTTAGDITLNNAVSASGVVDINAAGIINQAAGVMTAGLLDVNSSGGATFSSGAVESFTAVENAGGTIALVNNSAGGTLNLSSVTSNGGDIIINETDAINVTGLLNSGAGAVTLTAASAGIGVSSGISSTGTVDLTAATDINGANISAGTLNLTAATGIGATTPLATSASNINFSNTASGIVQISNSVTDVTVGGSNAGVVNLTATSGTLNIGNLTTTDSAITLLANDGISASGMINSGAGAVSINAVDGARPIRIGSMGAADSLDIGATLLLNLTTTGGVTIGSEANSGSITVAGNTDAPGVNGGGLTLVSQGSVAVNATLSSNADTLLRSTNSGVSFGSGAIVQSAAGSITIDSGAAIGGSGSLELLAATDLIVNREMVIDGATTINVGSLNLQQNITTTAGKLEIISAGTVTFNPDLILTAAGPLNIQAVGTGAGNLDLIGEGISLAMDLTINGTATLNAGAGEIKIEGVLATGGASNIVITASDFDLNGSIDSTGGSTTISDGGNGFSLGQNQIGRLSMDVTEYEAITADSLILASAGDLRIATSFNSASVVALTINAATVTLPQAISLTLGGSLDFSDSTVNASAGLNIGVTGSYSMNGLVDAQGAVVVNATEGVTMGEPAVISTADGQVDITTAGGDVLLGLIDAGNANVNITASAGSILNNNGVFTNVTRSVDNVRSTNVSLDANARIGVSSTDAITLNINRSGLITLDFNAPKAFINNRNNTRIANLGSGDVAIGIVFSNEIIGIGHSVGSNSNSEGATMDAVAQADAEPGQDLISVLGPDFNVLEDEEDEAAVSTLAPVVPVLIRTRSGWEFKAPSRNVRPDSETLPNSPQQQKGLRMIDWL